MNLSQYIRRYREQHGMSIGHFAKSTGLSKAYISMLERNRNSNGEPIVPSVLTLIKIAEATNTTLNDLVRILEQDIQLSDVGLYANHQKRLNSKQGKLRIPILGRVVAGVPIEAIEEVLGYVDLDDSLSKRGDYFALQVKGDSMTPTLHDGDIIIVRKQEDINSGELGIVLVNGDEATVKEVKKSEAGITLIGHNASVYPPHFYSREEVESLPVQIIGKVVKMERWF